MPVDVKTADVDAQVTFIVAKDGIKLYVLSIPIQTSLGTQAPFLV